MEFERSIDGFPRLETKRFSLRAITLADTQAMFRVWSDEEVMQYHDLEPPKYVEQVQGLIHRWAVRFNSRQGIRWGIVRKTDNVLIGSCGYRYKDAFVAELGYELAKAYWRQGVMTEALKAIVVFGFETLNLNRIEARVMLENNASTQLLKKLGFQQEGILREYGYWKGQFHDLRLFSLLKRDAVGD
jgi:ribosomal-protein-alanine N-acetyltransferase